MIIIIITVYCMPIHSIKEHVHLKKLLLKKKKFFFTFSKFTLSFDHFRVDNRYPRGNANYYYHPAVAPSYAKCQTLDSACSQHLVTVSYRLKQRSDLTIPCLSNDTNLGKSKKSVLQSNKKISRVDCPIFPGTKHVHDPRLEPLCFYSALQILEGV